MSFLLPLLIYFLFYYFMGILGGKLKYKTWNFLFKTFFQKPSCIFFPFPWIFLKNKRGKEDCIIFFTIPTDILMKHNRLFPPDPMEYSKDNMWGRVGGALKSFLIIQQRMSSFQITSSLHRLCTSYPWPKPHKTQGTGVGNTDPAKAEWSHLHETA